LLIDISNHYLYPRLARTVAQAAPIPLAPPVTTTIDSELVDFICLNFEAIGNECITILYLFESSGLISLELLISIRCFQYEKKDQSGMPWSRSTRCRNH
jgi:hypothetical protein